MCIGPDSIQVWIILKPAFINIRHVHDRLTGDQVQVAYDLAFVLVEIKRANGEAFVQVRFNFADRVANVNIIFVIGLGIFLGFEQLFFDGLEICQRQLGIDCLDIVDGIDPAGHMGHVFIFEAAHHVYDGVGFPDVGKKLVAEPLALGRPGDQPCNIDELHRGRNGFLRTDDALEHAEPRIGYRHHADIGVNRTKRVVLGRNFGRRQCIEQRRFTDIGQSNYAAFNRHQRQRPWYVVFSWPH